MHGHGHVSVFALMVLLSSSLPFLPLSCSHTHSTSLRVLAALCGPTCLCGGAAAKDDEHIGSDVGDDIEDPNQEPPPEAVEAEELQFGKNKKKKRAQESDSQMQVCGELGGSCAGTSS